MDSEEWKFALQQMVKELQDKLSTGKSHETYCDQQIAKFKPAMIQLVTEAFSKGMGATLSTRVNEIIEQMDSRLRTCEQAFADLRK